MSDTRGHGQKLAEYLDELRGLESMRSFAQTRGIDHQAISRWRTGDPSIEAMRQIADGLSKPLGEILIIAGYGSAEDFGGMHPTPPKAPSLEDAIAHDPTLTPGLRRALQEILDLARKATPMDGRTGTGGKRTIRIGQ